VETGLSAASVGRGAVAPGPPMVSTRQRKSELAPRDRPWMKTLRITWTKSTIGYAQRQRDTIVALGLHRLNQCVEKADNPSIRGMIERVRHLVKVEEIEE
jgi:large subunit ribosomal protein L30